MVLASLGWIGERDARFLAAAWGGFLLATLIAAAPAWRRRWWNSGWAFVAALGVALAAFRWPHLAWNAQLTNPDESQLLAGALTFARDPVPFRSVDGNTSGPLNGLALLAFARATFQPLDYTTARLFGVVCLVAILAGTWRTLRAFASPVLARVLVLPGLPLFGAAWFFDIAQLNTEHLPAALLALAPVPLLGPLLRHAPVPAWRLALTGVLAGAAPLAKPQAAPMSAWLVAVLLVVLWRTGLGDAPRRTRLAWLATGAAAPGLAIGLLCAATGVLGDAYASFLANNASYIGLRHFPLADSLPQLAAMLRLTGTLDLAAVGTVAALAVGVVLWGSLAPPARTAFVAAAGLVAAAVAAVLIPGRPFTHYLVFLLGPSLLLPGLVAALACERFRDRPGGRAAVAAGWAALALLPYPVLRGGATPAILAAAPDHSREAAVATALKPYRQSGDTLAVWGWEPRYHVALQMPQAAREAITARQIADWGSREYYRARFLDDLRRQPPACLIDATGPGNFGYVSRPAHGVETDPELLRWLVPRYALVGDVAGARLFVRRDRLPAPPRAAELPPGVCSHAPAFVHPGPLQTAEAAGHPRLFAHAPSLFIWPSAATPRRVSFRFSIDDRAYRDGNRCDGADFRVVLLRPGGPSQVVFARALRPLTHTGDRGEFAGEVEIPAGAEVALETTVGDAGDGAFDWCYWREIQFSP